MIDEKTVVQTIESVSSDASTSSNNDRDASGVKAGEALRQGDIYLVRLRGNSKLGAVVDSRQLVVGNSRGARHIVKGDAQLHEPAASIPDWINGDAFRCMDISVGPKGASLTHPEHATFHLPGGTKWAAWQQSDPRTRNRVLD